MAEAKSKERVAEDEVEKHSQSCRTSREMEGIGGVGRLGRVSRKGKQVLWI